jgi:nickel transport protein
MKTLQVKQISILFIILLALIPADFAHAHKVIIFAWVEDGMIFSESHFGSKREAKNCNISIMNGKGELVLKGKSDNQGKYSFKIPENIESGLVLHLDAGTGHKAHWKIPENELSNNTSNDDIETAMETKAKLEENPSLYKIVTGIGIIFLLAMALKFFKKGSKKSD